MNISIQSYQTNYLAKPSPLGKTATEADTVNGGVSVGQSSGETVSISGQAKALYNLSSAAERQATMSSSELSRLYAKKQSDFSRFSQVISGRNYNEKDLLPETDDPARLAVAQQALNFAVGLSYPPPNNQPNPFAGMARNDLSAIAFDDTDAYSEVERYAAYVELRKQDQEYFSTLFAKAQHSNDRREVYKGILEHFDALPPVEKAAYPESYRETVQSLFDKQVERWGPLAMLLLADNEAEDTAPDEPNPFEAILDKEQTTAEMLQEILAKAQEASSHESDTPE